MIWEIRDLLICIFQVYMLMDLVKCVLPYRKLKVYIKGLVYITVVFAITLVNEMNSTVSNIIMIPVLYLSLTLIIFRGNFLLKLALTYFYYVLAIVPEFIFAVVTGAYGVTGSTTEFQSEFEKTVAILIMKLFTFLIIKLINYKHQRRDYTRIEHRMFLSLLALPMATIIILSAIYYSDLAFIGVNNYIFPIGILFLLLTNVFIFLMFDKFVTNIEKTKIVERLYQKSLAENKSLKYMEKTNEEHRILLHDINKYVYTAGSMIQENNNKEAIKILEQIGVKIKTVSIYEYTNNMLLNSILCERKYMAETLNVSMSIDVGKTIITDFIEELDLISIVGNLLDNAIEAAEKMKSNGFVSYKMYMTNHNNFLMIEVRNNYLEQPKKRAHRFLSTKNDMQNHGIGLYTVEKLVEKYKGIMKVDSQNKLFKVSILLVVVKK